MRVRKAILGLVALGAFTVFVGCWGQGERWETNPEARTAVAAASTARALDVTAVPTPLPSVFAYEANGENLRVSWHTDSSIKRHWVECGMKGGAYFTRITYDSYGSEIPGHVSWMDLTLDMCSGPNEWTVCRRDGCEFWVKHRSEGPNGWMPWSRVEFEYERIDHDGSLR